MDADLERARRSFALRGGVEEAACVLAALLRARGARAACGWVRAQVGDEGWLLREEAARLRRARRAALGASTRPGGGHDLVPGVARLIGVLGLLDRVVAGDWPMGVDAADVALSLEAWRRLRPVVLTERLVTGVLSLTGATARAGRPRLLGLRAGLEGALGRALRRVAFDLGLEPTEPA